MAEVVTENALDFRCDPGQLTLGKISTAINDFQATSWHGNLAALRICSRQDRELVRELQRIGAYGLRLTTMNGVKLYGYRVEVV